MQNLDRLNLLIDRASKIYGSNRQLAFALGKNPQQISDWKHGRKEPGTDIQAKLAEIAALT
ncbi:MAG: hypothetical protein IPF55_15545 [Rhodoferax sp.]|nr:hypothetical protein [Rhodoferax sp.]